MDAGTDGGGRARRPRRADRGGRERRRRSARGSGRGPGSSSCAAGRSRPGFGDAHVHPVDAGLGRISAATSSGARRARRLARASIAAYAASHPDEPWIRGDGWSMPALPGRDPAPRRPRPGRARPAGLSRAATATRPGSTAGRSSSPASAPTRRTPTDGRIERDADGNPSGALQEGARRSSSDSCPPTSADDLVAALRLAQAELHALGITHWQDAIVDARGRGDRLHDPGRTRRADRAGRRGAVVGPRARRRADRRAGRAPRADSLGRYRPTSVKMMQDGVLENFTAAVLEPYLDADGVPTTNRGLSLIDPRCFGGHVARLDALGFQVHFHAIGERAVREALDAIETARRGQRPDGHAAAHRPHPGHPSRRHRTVRAARRRGQRPGALGGPSAPDGRPDDPVPRDRNGRPGSTRSARSCGPERRSRWAPTGLSRARTRCWRWRWPSRASTSKHAASGRRSCPMSGSS